MHIRREIQVTPDNLQELMKLSQEGVVLKWSYDMGDVRVLLNDGKTTVEHFGWLLEDTEGRWWGMESGYHRLLVEYQKIVKEE